jgi:hypothetical protein
VLEIAIIVIILALVARAVANKLSKNAPLTAALAGSAAAPTFRVVALGVAGSGKTVFLASMFHRLHVASPGGSYFLETAADQRVALSRLFQQVERTDLPWPRGTRVGETREFTFDCMAVRGGEKHKVLSLNYLDYAGELLEAEQEEGPHALAGSASNVGSPRMHGPDPPGEDENRYYTPGGPRVCGGLPGLPRVSRLCTERSDRFRLARLPSLPVQNRRSRRRPSLYPQVRGIFRY